eukprot:jgi/Mesen1/6148/ME000314S05159
MLEEMNSTDDLRPGLYDLGEDILGRILEAVGLTSISQVAALSCVSRRFQKVTGERERAWRPFCVQEGRKRFLTGVSEVHLAPDDWPHFAKFLALCPGNSFSCP